MTKCHRCNAQWGGLRTGHCMGCHHTFTGVEAFDRHRAGSHANGQRHCLSMEEAKLVDAGRSYPCWKTPGEDIDELA